MTMTSDENPDTTPPAAPVNPLTNPSFDVTRLPVGTTILVETDLEVIEMKVVQAKQAVLEITSTAAALHQPTLGELLYSAWPNDPTLLRKACIVKDFRMVFRFRNGEYATSIVRSASVRGMKHGQPWHYDVFGGTP